MTHVVRTYRGRGGHARGRTEDVEVTQEDVPRTHGGRSEAEGDTLRPGVTHKDVPRPWVTHTEAAWCEDVPGDARGHTEVVRSRYPGFLSPKRR